MFLRGQLSDGGRREILLGDADEYIEAMNLGPVDFIAIPYRSTEIVFVVDGACKRCRLGNGRMRASYTIKRKRCCKAVSS